MSTASHTRRLVEHRFGHPLSDLRRRARRDDDPVLPVVLHRLDALALTGERIHATRILLDVLLDPGATPHVTSTTLERVAGEIEELERQEQAEAQAIWDLLDLRLLLHQPARHLNPAGRCQAGVDGEVLAAARRLAPRLPRLTRDALGQALRNHGIRLSNQRLSNLLHQLRTEHLLR